MATDNHTSTTHEEFARLFPITGRPFAVWYSDDPSAKGCNWTVNGEDGEGREDFEDMQIAFNTSAEWGKEWETEARKQALAIANLSSNSNAESKSDNKYNYALLNATDKFEEIIALAHLIQSVLIAAASSQPKETSHA
jgi:hypothetical protein